MPIHDSTLTIPIHIGRRSIERDHQRDMDNRAKRLWMAAMPAMAVAIDALRLVDREAAQEAELTLMVAYSASLDAEWPVLRVVS